MIAAATVAGLAGAALVAAALWMCLPFRVQVSTLTFLAPLQVFVPIGSLPPLSVVLVLLTAAQHVWRVRRVDPLLVVALLGGATAAASLFVRTDDVDAVRVDLVGVAVLVASLVLGRTAAERGGVTTRSIVVPWLLAALVDAVLVILFRLAPDAEIAFLRSGVARLVVNPSTLGALFAGSPNNVLDPEKAGAFFVNANAGSAFLGVACCMSLAMATRSSRSVRWYAAAALFAVAVVASGSKTGAALLFLLVVWVLVQHARRRNVLAMYLLTISPIGLVWLVPLVTGEAAAIATASSTRGFLWALAVGLIAQSPLLGSGYGAWSEWSASSLHVVGSSGGYLPHNIVLTTWIDQGVLGVVVLLALWILMTRRALLVGAGGFVVAAVWWTIAHSLGDNTGVLLDAHTLPMLAMVLGAAGQRLGPDRARSMPDPSTTLVHATTEGVPA